MADTENVPKVGLVFARFGSWRTRAFSRALSARIRLKETMMIKEHDLVVLTEGLLAEGLEAGDVGTVVMVHSVPGYEVEFTTLDGQTVAIVSVFPNQVRPVGKREVA